jgi:hypothetical protein
MDYSKYREVERCIHLAERALADLVDLRVQSVPSGGPVDFARREAAIQSTLDDLYDQQADFAANSLAEQERGL